MVAKSFTLMRFNYQDNMNRRQNKWLSEDYPHHSLGETSYSPSAEATQRKHCCAAHGLPLITQLAMRSACSGRDGTSEGSTSC